MNVSTFIKKSFEQRRMRLVLKEFCELFMVSCQRMADALLQPCHTCIISSLDHRLRLNQSIEKLECAEACLQLHSVRLDAETLRCL